MILEVWCACARYDGVYTICRSTYSVTSYTSRPKCMCVYLSIDLKSITDDRLRTHIQNADPVDFLMLYLTTSLSAPWTRVLLPSELQSRRKGSDCNEHASALLSLRSRSRLPTDMLTSSSFCSRKSTQAKLSSTCSSTR